MLVVADYRMGQRDEFTAEHCIGKGLSKLIVWGANGHRSQIDYGQLAKAVAVPLGVARSRGNDAAAGGRSGPRLVDAPNPRIA